MYIRAKKYYKIISLLIMVLLITGCSQSKDETTQGPTDNTSAEVNQSDTNPDSSTDSDSDANSDTEGMDQTDSDEAEELIDAQVLSYNEPIVTNIFTADPSAHVFNGTLYIYPSHDPDYIDPNTSSQDGGQYLMEDYHVLTITDFDSECVDNGEALNLRDVPWAKQQLWAPDAAYKNGMYYLYFPAKDQEDIFRMGVATSSEPTGPFVAEPDYIEGSYSIDPAVFTDEDDQTYMIFGGIWGGQLERWQTGTYVAGGTEPMATEPALGPVMAVLSEDMLSFEAPPTEIKILDETGNPILAGDESRRFFEAAWVHKYNEKYYLSYSTGSTHLLVYAMSDNIEGPYTYQGQILQPVLGWTSHHSIVEFENQWYLFYHDASLSGGIDYQRSVKYMPLEYNEDGTIKPITP